VEKSKGKRQKAKGKNQKSEKRSTGASSFLLFAFCLLPFDFSYAV